MILWSNQYFPLTNVSLFIHVVSFHHTIIQIGESQYGAGVEYLQSPLGRHIAMQQELELRRRQIEEQHLISELEYQSQLRRLQQQQQLQGPFNMYGQHYHPAMSDDYLLQQQQQMMLQEQIAQQQMRAQMSQQRDQEELLSMIHRGNNNLNPHYLPYHTEQLPGSRLSAEMADSEIRDETDSNSSPAQSSLEASAEVVSPPKRKRSSSSGSSPPKKSPSPRKEKSPSPRKKSSPSKESNGAWQSLKRAEPSENGIDEIPNSNKISYSDLIAVEESTGVTEVEEAPEYAQDVSDTLSSTKVDESSTDRTTKADNKALIKKVKEKLLNEKKVEDDVFLNEKRGGDDVEKAGSIVMNFLNVNVPPDEIKMATKWSRQSQVFTTTYQEISEEDSPFISPRMKFNIHPLPLEPESTGDSDSDGDVPMMEDSGEGSENRKEAAPLTAPQHVLLKPKTKLSPRVGREGLDEWWPTNQAIRKERRKRGLPVNEEDTDEEIDAKNPQPTVSFNKAGIRSSRKRLKSSVEPGVLEKLPHCKLYDDHCNDENKTNFTPKFCCQTTETFPYKAMVCCSICSTWRHAQCGGHYKQYSADNTDPSNMLFVPICDACHLEKPFVSSNPDGAKRLDRQRTEHLRSCNATNAVMRQYAFSKHAGPYKWPLGNVVATHASGHIKSAQGRHEKSEKQWADMVQKLGKTDMKARERLRVRTREFERLLFGVEDAERVTDCHNMSLFLRNDVRRTNPVGFENPRRNIFDPEDDIMGITNPEELSIPNNDDAVNTANNLKPSPLSPAEDGLDAILLSRTNNMGNGSNHTGRQPSQLSKARKGDADETVQSCARQGCTHKPRFDSIFCSDSCGIAIVEADLLQSLEYSSEMHPATLR
jgi:hypothetical protein